MVCICEAHCEFNANPDSCVEPRLRSDFSLPFLVWIVDLKLQDPTFVIQECTGRFDVTTFRSIMQPEFFVQNVKFCPTDLGIPVHRLRSYCFCTNKKYIVTRVPMSMECLQEVFFRKVVTDAQIFFRAPDSYVNQYLNQLAKAFNAPDIVTELKKEGVNSYKPEHYMGPGDCLRVQAHIRKAREQGQTFVCCMPAQNEKFYKFDSACPALLRKSKIFGQTVVPPPTSSSEAASPKTVSRLLTPYEHLGIQGVPVLLRRDHRLSRILPKALTFSNIYYARSSLVEASLASFAGNGMHLAQVGLCILFSFFSVALAKDDDIALD